MRRRTFLKLSVTALGAAALGQLRWGLANQTSQELIIVSNAGDANAGVLPSVSLIEPNNLQVVATLALPSSYSFPATRWDFERDVIWTGLPAGPNNAVNAFRLSTGEQIAEVPTGSSQNYTELTSAPQPGAGIGPRVHPRLPRPLLRPSVRVELERSTL
ncbi:MAG: hypothetical protein JSV66_07310 [Trueperaceae bacterium]|nr:MAG: hypothetical protein JSV66_07310 [Trueperaceae bacterium]